MVATGTVRTAVENRLVEIFAALDGFSDQARPGAWFVTPPLNGKMTARRWIVIGVAPDGDIEADSATADGGIAATVDVWTIRCGLACTDVAASQAAKQACEDALNAMADLLAIDDRIGMNGPRNVEITRIRGPFSVLEQGQPRFTWIDFDITAQADIERNPA